MTDNKTGMRKPFKPQVSLVAKIKAQLIAAMERKILSFEMLAQIKREGEDYEAGLSTREGSVGGGGDPAFALYASVLETVSQFAKVLLQLPDLRTFSKRLETLDSDYVPGIPPMSPVTESHFAMWTHCDLRVGDGSETLAGIFAEIGDVFGFGADYLALAKALANSRMGIFEHFGLKRGRTCLRELVTDKEIPFVGCSGYAGSKGELWFVRAVPPPLSFHYWVGMGTPYVLRAPGRFEWLALFERNGIRSGELGMEQRLWQFLKFGPRLRYWSELIFEGYCGHHSGAVFLQGLPDVPESRLHSDHFNPNYALG